jgi:hypothetical protein
LTFFDPTELVNFRKVNSFFKSLIDESTTFQYRIALFASGMTVGPPSALATSERLELLRRYEASWKNIEWSEHNTIVSPDGHLWEFYGNVWAHSRGSDAIEFVQLPSRIRGIPMRQWTLRFDFSVRDFSMDPSQDLLVTIEDNLRNLPNIFRIQLRTLSTGEKHPFAGSTAVVDYTLTTPEPIDRWSYSIRISGDYVGILFQDILESGNRLVVWSWRTGVQKLVVLSGILRSFVFLGDNFILGSTLQPPALLVYSLEQSLAGGTAQANTHLLRFLIETPAQDTTDILLASDPSPGQSPSSRPQVPFLIAGDERIITMNVQTLDHREVHLSETSLIPTKTLLGYIENRLINGGHDVDWESYGQLLSERVPGHGRWGMWTCFVFGMRHILPNIIYLNFQPMVIIRDLSPRRCLRASKEERKKSNALHQAMTGGPRSKSYPRSILRCVPLPECIEDPLGVNLMIGEDGIVALEEANITGVGASQTVAHLLTF